MRSPRSLAVLAFVAFAVGLTLAHASEVRDRAEAALGKGMPAREAGLARSFVLGEEEDVDSGTVEDFRRAGLSHLLAVSGQNVALLALLAMPALAGLGMPMRTRLLWVLGLIVVYVPLAGAGPSILRAGIMGALSVLATLGGRRASRLYGLLVAALLTLALEPRIASDVGWQLSFAAVLGILLLAPLLRGAIESILVGPLSAPAAAGTRLEAGRFARGLADAAALTIAATVATAPLIAFRFGAISTTTLLANLLALPAVAPAMWLGMMTAAAGQVPGFPVVVLNWLEAPLLAYIAQVATGCGRPGWAYLHLRLGLAGLLASYLAIGATTILSLRLGRAMRLRRARARRAVAAAGHRFPSSWRRWARLGGAWLALGLLLTVGASSGADAPAPPTGLRVSILDVGQGDAILLQPAAAPAVLVDGGPPGDGLERLLRGAGVTRLGVVAITHDQADHAGGIRELLGEMPVGRLVYGALEGPTLARALAAGVPAQRLAAGGGVRSGKLRLDVLWPPPELLAEPPPDDDPNQLALVFLLRWGRFRMLLTADAEAEATLLDPGPLDVLKVAHHGSDDAGLDALLDRTGPRLAVISVGAGNPFGHPTAATLRSLAAHGVRALRTDLDGTVVLEVGHGTVTVHTGD